MLRPDSPANRQASTEDAIRISAPRHPTLPAPSVIARLGLLGLALAVLLAVVLPAQRLQAAPESQLGPGTAYTTDRLNLRTRPSLKARIITVMPESAMVRIKAGPRQEFYLVQYRQLKGWAHGDYLTPADRPQRTRLTRPTRFEWPATGRISQYFSSTHMGIDVDLWNRAGSPIRAAGDGKVAFAGGQGCCSYGLYVLVRHPDGLVTMYAHLSGFAVKTGDRVRTGEAVGFAGQTGKSTGVHLHFEVHKGGSPQNPLDYLP